jgi:ABC-type phosphate/phosphonate transport system substrate-binding protein
MKRVSMLIAAGAMSLSMIAGVAQAADINFGVQASRGADKAKAQWEEFGKYLSGKLGKSVEIVPLKPDQTESAFNGGDVHFVLSNPTIAVILEEKSGAKPLATMKTKAGAQFAGVIMCNKKKGITDAAGMKGKKVMAYKFKKSAAAYVFQVAHLKAEGVDPHADFAVFKEAKKQDDIALAVKAGVMDCGFVKSGMLETLEKEGKVKISDYTIIDQKSGDGYAPVHSTVLYPSWTVMAGASVDPAMADAVKSALLSLGEGDPAAKKAKLVGFVEPLSLEGLKKALRDLGLPPYGS